MESEKDKNQTKVDSKGQHEMTINDTPLWLACEKMVLAKSHIMSAKKEMEDSEIKWCKIMKEINKSKINHKGDIIQFVRGKTTDDHARFCKS